MLKRGGNFFSFFNFFPSLGIENTRGIEFSKFLKQNFLQMWRFFYSLPNFLVSQILFDLGLQLMQQFSSMNIVLYLNLIGLFGIYCCLDLGKYFY